jgi:hypothetical protein
MRAVNSLKGKSSNSKLSIPKLFNGLVGSTRRNEFLLEHHPVLLDFTDLLTVIL